jgi:hypothetical protein
VNNCQTFFLYLLTFNMKKKIDYPITIFAIVSTMIVTFSTMPIVSLHDLFLQDVGASIQPMSPEPEIYKTLVLPGSSGTRPAAVDDGSNQTEPCISPCPPGQICIQMCKPIGQPETLTTTPEPSPSSTATNTGEEQEQQLTLAPSLDKTTTNTEEQEQPPVPNDEDMPLEDEGKDTMTQLKPTDGNEDDS